MGLRFASSITGEGPEDSLLVEVRIPSEAVTCSNRQVRDESFPIDTKAVSLKSIVRLSWF
jgi:hypothetical protein